MIAPAAAILARGIALADHDGQERIVPQLVVIIEVFVTQGQSEDPLPQKLLDRVFDPFFVAMIGKTLSQLPDDARVLLDLSQQQTTGIRGDRAAVKPDRDSTAGEGLKIERLSLTLCGHWAASLLLDKCLSTKSLMPKAAALFHGAVRNAG